MRSSHTSGKAWVEDAPRFAAGRQENPRVQVDKGRQGQLDAESKDLFELCTTDVLSAVSTRFRTNSWHLQGSANMFYNWVATLDFSLVYQAKPSFSINYGVRPAPVFTGNGYKPTQPRFCLTTIGRYSSHIPQSQKKKICWCQSQAYVVLVLGRFAKVSAWGVSALCRDKILLNSGVYRPIVVL